MESLNEKIKRLRKAKGLSQEKMAVSSGISQASYSNIEKGGESKSISIHVGKCIAEILGVPFNELFEIESPSESEDNLKQEIERLKKEIIRAEEQLEDKRRSILFFEDTLEFFSLFYLSIINELMENENISAHEMFQNVKKYIEKEKGEFVFALTEKGHVRIHFLTDEEKKLRDKSVTVESIPWKQDSSKNTNKS